MSDLIESGNVRCPPCLLHFNQSPMYQFILWSAPIFGISSSWYCTLRIDWFMSYLFESGPSSYSSTCIILGTWVVVSPHAGWLPIHQDDHERRWRPHLPALCRGDGHHWPAAQAMQMRLRCMSTDPPPILSYRSDCSLPCLRCVPSSNNNCHLTLQICVWCWHHIIDMAEKEETEGRCPACRTRYDKDRIVKMAATCDRSVAMLLLLPINFCCTSEDWLQHLRLITLLYIMWNRNR